MKICYLKDNIKYIEEFVLICHEEWGTPWEKGEEKDKLNKKVEKEKLRLEKFPTLILLDDDNLVGFVSLFENDLDEKNYLTPWYATLYIKEEYRGRHLSKMLNDAIIKEAKKLNYKKIYLKTELENFYEKYGFKFLEQTSSG